MDDKQLEEIWKKMQKETFEKFAEEYLGYNPETKEGFDCYGSGDHKPWCYECLKQSSC